MQNDLLNQPALTNDQAVAEILGLARESFKAISQIKGMTAEILRRTQPAAEIIPVKPFRLKESVFEIAKEGEPVNAFIITERLKKDGHAVTENSVCAALSTLVKDDKLERPRRNCYRLKAA